jgi:tetratricopeptide (TPR) repeat protein
MTRRRQQTDTPLDRISELLEEAPLGLHDLRSLDEVAAEVEADAGPSGTGAQVASVVIPVPLSEIYLVAGPGTLFHETLEIFAPNQLGGDAEHGIRFGTCDGDDLWLDARGRVRRFDSSLDQVVVEGSSLDRWLWGALDGYAHLVDHEGEFAEDAFDDDGELTDDCALRILAAQLRRDPTAVGPRLRRATLLARTAIDLARAELEEVVRIDPDLPWGWSELAKISEAKGELPGALDEARAAAESAEKLRHPQAGYFWAQVARFFSASGDEAGRAAAAAKAARLAPELKAAQLAGADAELEAGDVHAAGRLVDLLRAVWPRDLEVIDLRRRIEQRTD